jgi:hypothetical protein
MFYKTTETYKFSVEELETDTESFAILHPYKKDVYDIVEEAARLFYYGKSGWTHSWPLTFVIHTNNNTYVTRASVFILSSIPSFDVILI